MIDIDADGRIRTVTIDRPEARNALTVDGLEALEAAVADADEPVIYLRGRGPAFSAGADLNEVAALDGDRDRAAEFARLGQRVARTIEDSPAVVVAGIDGPARGGGLELALACDVRVGTPESTYGEPGVSFGLFGAWGGTVRLPRVLGEGDALEFALSGRAIDAEAALRMGLISRIEDEPRAVAAEIADNATDALAVLKRRLRDDGERATQERREAAAFADLVAAHADDVDALLE
ncbi:enoyl-CoA hydratase/isomerase family protein [Natrinema thermotolerans]|uniref:Enoyl-CoA hydratase/isomerase family protein n=1 Tax=Natrinema thermotolerans TaxID=121872 RepID=A0AAF0PEE8_9EURY|nr:enoyl-CoA hydratase/isomerase family protein [Natrinema thermotolerans]QCC58505.1 enoyl-CoA hydratase/isomerase family protein [Natrinema thermotolerans]WMT09640.1 enoyl-CoA hydratase/isomerase family protein [Natrinema thermotolerans]